MSPLLECHDVSVHYGPVRAVDGFDLEVSHGETVALLGPSGSGKSTVMYSIAGFIPISRGTIRLGGREVSGGGRSAPPEKRPVALVFQNYALWPHLSVLENVAYPLRREGRPKSESLSEAQSLLAKVGIAELAQRSTAELSGGQQQRVGLARALARSADLYLFDEPTAHLDSMVRASVAGEIRRRRKELGAAAIYATHDSEEALAIADRVLILKDGKTVQTGTPAEVYERPSNTWAARLTGPISEIEGKTVGTNGHRLRVSLGGSAFVADAASPDVAGDVRVLVRPEWVTPGGAVRGRIESIAYRGPHTDYTVVADDFRLIARLPGSPALSQGEMSTWTIGRGWVPPGSGAG